MARTRLREHMRQERRACRGQEVKASKLSSIESFAKRPQ
jgi:hypothetical protein